METEIIILNRLTVFIISLLIAFSCSNTGNKNSCMMEPEYRKGTFGYDKGFFEKNKISTIELRDSLSGASVLIAPGYQGRVMTSTSHGNHGKSYGWINYKLIESGIVSPQFNPVGGEERLWIGPEGGPFSIYFRKGDEQVFRNWKVPAELDTVSFDLVSSSDGFAEFRKEMNLVNASGKKLDIAIQRSIKLLTREVAEMVIGTKICDSISFVAYESENTLKNIGNEKWTASTGFLSVWMLAMFNTSENGVVFIPFKPGSESELGKIVSDDYFGKVPADRLLVKDNVLFFKIDGKCRSKIGISPKRALPFCGSYDPDGGVLTLLWYTAPEQQADYVNSKWGKQDDPLNGDAVNSYNDGPVEDGSVMGPFYEIESSSPAAFLSPGENMTHVQRVFHFSGDEAQLSILTEKLFNISIKEIVETFTK